MTLPTYMYRDPQQVLEHRQASTCAGCKNLNLNRWNAVTKFVCAKGHQKASLNLFEMRRCGNYREPRSEA